MKSKMDLNNRRQDMYKRALLVTDPQNDFFEDGALGVKDSNIIIDPTNRLMYYYDKNGLPIFISRDWHPAVTRHFKKYNGQWPEHGIQDTHGAMFHPDLIIPASAIIINKGESPEEDDYDPFKGWIWVTPDSGRRFYISLEQALESMSVEELTVCELATDWCVKAAALHARKLRFRTLLPLDACKAVNLNIPNDPWRLEPKVQSLISSLEQQGLQITDENIALEEMRQAGVIFTSVDAIIRGS